MAIIKSTIKVGQKPTEEELKRIRNEIDEAQKHPIVYTDDCPQLTDEQLAEFRPANYATWEERAQAMREKGIIGPEIEEHRPAKKQDKNEGIGAGGLI